MQKAQGVSWREGIAMGLDADAEERLIGGLNVDVDASLETVWNGGGAYPLSTLDAAPSLAVVSTAAADGLVGVGARAVFIQGLNSDHEVATETVNLGGLTEKAVSTSFIRIFEMRVASTGTALTNVGTITLKAGSTVVAQIDTGGGNRSRMCVYTVPAGYTAYAVGVEFALEGGNHEVADFLLIKRSGSTGVWIEQYSARVANGDRYHHTFDVPLRFDAQADVEVRAVGLTSDANARVAAYISLIVLKNPS